MRKKLTASLALCLQILRVQEVVTMRQKRLWELFFETGAPELYVMSKQQKQQDKNEKTES